MRDLPDVNVWLALADGNHSHHATAQRYWQDQAAPVVAFCRVSMLGFLRLSTHRNVLSRQLTPEEAWDIYQQYRGRSGVEFLHELDTTEAIFKALTCQTDFSPQLWTDAWFAALAMDSACRLVSFDSDFARFPGLDFLHLTL